MLTTEVNVLICVEAGNFQEHNFGRGGKGADAVIANAQDGSGCELTTLSTETGSRLPTLNLHSFHLLDNNANFATPRE